MTKRVLALSRVYRLLEPGPVVMVATSRKGRPNIMTMSWHMMVDFEPPIVACVISNRNYTFATLRATRVCTINIPTAQWAAATVGCGNTSGQRIDKFQAFGLSPRPASHVDAPLIAECYANLECRIIDSRMVTKYNLFILEVVKAWIDPSIKDPKTMHHRGRGVFMIAGETMKLPSRMK